MTDKQNWCQCEPTRCEGVGRCRWQAMDYRPGEARRQADRAEGFGADCLKIRVAMGLGLHSHDDLVETAAALRKDSDRWRHASTSRNFGITFWSEHGQGTCYDSLAVQRIDAALAAKK